jgi:hypothetical protein
MNREVLPMSTRPLLPPFNSRSRFAVILFLAAGCIAIAAPGRTAPDPQTASANPHASSMSGGMAHMVDHMYLTTIRPIKPGDKAKADAIVADAKQAMEPYKDYRKALADGYVIFLPNIPQPIYHFTNHDNGRQAATHFDPLKPTSLLYKKNPDGGYTLVGAMYTDIVTANEEELNDRIPLSVARWHQHTNFCKAPAGQGAGYVGPDARFGLLGSIHTREDCQAAGGVFFPHVFGWMVHVYPYESDPKKIWSVDDDDMGHDNMDRSSMPGMKMN